MKEKKDKIYIVPQNYTNFISSGELIKPRNIFEAVITTMLLHKLLGVIPFVFEIKTGISIIGCILCFTVFLIGYKDESLGTYLEGYIRYKLFRGVRRIRIPNKNNVKKQKGDLIESNYEKLIRILKYW